MVQLVAAIKKRKIDEEEKKGVWKMNGKKWRRMFGILGTKLSYLLLEKKLKFFPYDVFD